MTQHGKKLTVCSKDAIDLLSSVPSARSHFSVPIGRSHQTTVAEHALLLLLQSLG